MQSHGRDLSTSEATPQFASGGQRTTVGSQLVFSFHHVGPRVRAQVVQLDSERLCLLRHLAAPPPSSFRRELLNFPNSWEFSKDLPAVDLQLNIL